MRIPRPNLQWNRTIGPDEGIGTVVSALNMAIVAFETRAGVRMGAIFDVFVLPAPDGNMRITARFHTKHGTAKRLTQDHAEFSLLGPLSSYATPTGVATATAEPEVAPARPDPMDPAPDIDDIEPETPTDDDSDPGADDLYPDAALETPEPAPVAAPTPQPAPKPVDPYIPSRLRDEEVPVEDIPTGPPPVEPAYEMGTIPSDEDKAKPEPVIPVPRKKRKYTKRKKR